MKAESWIPLATFILGLVGALVTEALRDRRASNGERQARQAELQRSTLLELQDTLLELHDLANTIQMLTTELHAYEILGADTETVVEKGEQATQRFSDAEAKARLLISRVQDDEARRSATLLREAVGAFLLRSQAREADFHFPSEAYGRAIDLLGKLLRERYSGLRRSVSLSCS